jgi:hypothetical protein
VLRLALLCLRGLGHSQLAARTATSRASRDLPFLRPFTDDG